MYRKLILPFALFLFSVMPLFAQGLVPPGMQTLADNILEVFTSPFVRIILAIILCGAAGAYAFNRDNEKMKRNAIAIIVASGILMSAQFIVERIFAT